MIKDYLKKKLSDKQKFKLKRYIENIKTIGLGNNLDKLAKIYDTDKCGEHNYTPYYKLHLGKFKLKRVNLLEIGVGGYEKPLEGGGSLRMWRKYFTFGKIFSIDLHDKSFHQEKRIKIFKGSQVDQDFLSNVVSDIGQLDIIVDDGSHINKHVIETFKFLFPKMKDGGVYVVEDTQTSYWPDHGGDSENLNNPKTLMSFFKGLIDGLNHNEFIKSGYKKNYFDENIISMHYYHNMIFIYKGKNNRESNRVVNNQKTTDEYYLYN